MHIYSCFFIFVSQTRNRIKYSYTNEIDKCMIFEALETNTTLETLDLSGKSTFTLFLLCYLLMTSNFIKDNKIGDNALLPIKKSLMKNKTLKRLNLRGMPFTSQQFNKTRFLVFQTIKSATRE